MIPALPKDVTLDTLQSVFNQTLPVVGTFVTTEKLDPSFGSMLFPAKMALILNNALDLINLDRVDYVLRVDADTVLPLNFLEENVKGGYDIMGEGYAQLIKASVFKKHFGGRLHKDHDDGYILVKGRDLGLKITHQGYLVKPIKKRAVGFHQGGDWYFSQGDLKYRYGFEPIAFATNLIFGDGRCAYTIFEVFGWLSAFLHRKKRFDVADRILYRQLGKYRNPRKLLRIGGYGAKALRRVF